MSTLPDLKIDEYVLNNTISIEPYDIKDVQPASYDVHLTGDLKKIDLHNQPCIDLRKMIQNIRYVDQSLNTPLLQNRVYLGSTLEKIKLPDHIGARFEGKSSLGRLGLLTHVTAGFIDPGFEGNITVEIVNLSGLEVVLREGMPIGQLSFFEMDEPSSYPYGHSIRNSHYQNQSGPTGSVGV